MSRPPVGTVAVVLLLVLGTAIGASARPAHRTPAAASSVAVVGATVVCPELRQRKGVLATRVSVGSGLPPAGRDSAGGSVGARLLTKPATAVALPVTEAGQVAVGVATSTQDGLVVAASEDLAAGLEVEQVTRGESGADRGLAGLRCEAPKPDVWFVGGSTTLDNETTLILANPDETPATVNVALFSSQHPLTPPLGQGIVVRPHSRVGIGLDTLAPDEDLLAVHVQSSRGRVAAALRHARKSAVTTGGVDYVPQTTPPARRVVVPGFPQGPGTRVMQVTNPGTDDARFSVTVTTSDGQFVPSGLDSLDAPAGRSVTVDLTKLATASALSATVTSDAGPLLAGGLIRDGQTGPVREFSYTAGALPLSGPALVTDVVINRPTESTLVLTAPNGAATVQVSPVPVLGHAPTKALPKTVRIAAGRTATLRLSTFFPAGAKALLAVQVTPLKGSGPVYAARYLRERGAHGPLTTLLVLEGPAQLVQRPAVYSDPQLAAR